MKEEYNECVCQTPWTEEIGQTMDKLVKEKIKIKSGQPVFGTVIIDSDLIVYLNILQNVIEYLKM